MSCVIGDTQNDNTTINSCSMFGFKPRIYNSESEEEEDENSQNSDQGT